MSARCDKEEANFLALNLADDVATGEKSVDDARSEYADAIRKSMQGEKPEYMQGFAFNLPRGDAEDPDKTVMRMAGRQR